MQLCKNRVVSFWRNLIRLGRRRYRFTRLLLSLAVLSLLNANATSAQEIVLRDLSIISSVAVKSVDDEYLSLTDGQNLTWDRVLKSRVDPVWQKQVDERVRRIGLPLFRLKHRLQRADIRGAFDIANQWYENNEQQFVGDEANFLVARAIMLGRIRTGDREKALKPMLQALMLQQNCSQEFVASIPGQSFSDEELRSGICEDFLPIWNSTESSRSELGKLSTEFELDKLVSKWPGVAVYLSSLAVHAGQRERADNWNAAMSRVPGLRGWQQVLGTNLSQTPLSILIRNTSGQLRVSAMYWWSVDPEQLASKADRVLTLLKIVSNYGSEFPELSKMSLAKAIELSDDPEVKRALQTGVR